MYAIRSYYEAAIRQNPVKRTTDILQKVFGAK